MTVALWIIAALMVLLIPTAMVGVLVLHNVLVRPKTPPCDESNRIAHLRLVWFALTREEEFVDKFPWLKEDEWNNHE